MKYGKLVAENHEAEIVKRLLHTKMEMGDVVRRSSVGMLARELETADTRSEDQMPLDVVRLNSIVTIRSSFNGEQTFQIVLPSNSDIERKKLSLLAPMGMALFGYAMGDEVSWMFPSGKHDIRIVKVEQPNKIEA